MEDRLDKFIIPCILSQKLKNISKNIFKDICARYIYLLARRFKQRVKKNNRV